MALFARNLLILGSPSLLFLSGIPAAGFRLSMPSVTQEQERTYGLTFLIVAAILTFFTTWANIAKFAPSAFNLFSMKCPNSRRAFPCRKELSELFLFIFLLAMHPVVLSAALLAVNESDWNNKEAIKKWIWGLLIVSVLIYCVNGLLRQSYWYN
jgi:cobalamin biosynthesis protein CobD/CbiB